LSYKKFTKIHNAASSQVRFEKNIETAYYNAGVAVVNSEV
jgi:hypothetical protein